MASSLGWISNENRGNYESDFIDFDDLTQYTVQVEVLRYELDYSVLIALLSKIPF